MPAVRKTPASTSRRAKTAVAIAREIYQGVDWSVSGSYSSAFGASAPISIGRDYLAGSMQEFSDKTAPHQIPFEAFGLEIRFCTNSQELLADVQSMLPPGWRRLPRSSKQMRLGLLEQDNGVYSIYHDTICIHDAPGREYALMTLESQLSVHIATESPHFVGVHAGVVADADRAIVMPGFSFSGKTTLVRALVEAGAAYYSDEFAMIDDAGRVHPSARPLSFRPPDGRPVDLRVEQLGGVAGTEPLSVGMVIVTRYRPGGVWQPRQLSAGAAALAMLEHTISTQKRPQQAMRVARKATDGVVALEGERGEADELAGVLLENLRAAA